MPELDPVHEYIEGVGDPSPVHKGSGWYFYDETWSDVHGPFESEEQARRHCRLYGEWLNNGIKHT